MKSELIVSFPDQSKSFTYGVEFGRILEQMEQGKDIVCNHGFPIRAENKKLIEDSCKAFGYIPTFGAEHFGEWIEFMGIKKLTSIN